MRWQTFIDVLGDRARRHGKRTAFVFLADGEEEEQSLSFAELDRRARAIAADLSTRLAPGHRAILVLPSSLDYVCAFFGCLYAGVTGVTAHTPRFEGSLRERDLRRLQAIIDDSQPGIVLTNTQVAEAAHRVFPEMPSLRALPWHAIDRVDDHLVDTWKPPPVSPDQIAFLQYTSGSTSTPKGVMVSHANLLHNQRVMQRAYDHDETTRIVSWLPLFHDMGLIGQMLHAVYLGGMNVFMSPESFVARPVRWLQAISRFRGTSALSPNFGYDICARKTTRAERATLDLSSWRVAGNASEPVRASTLRAFTRLFGPCGFRKQAFFPSYGLAEATLIVTAGPRAGTHWPRVTRVLSSELDLNRFAPTKKSAAETRLLASSGPPCLHRIEIVDPISCLPVPPGVAGEIWVCGESVARGYWHRPEETEFTFHARFADGREGTFLRTGDLGFLHRGHLYVAGRVKDLIILRGNNYYPQDIEATLDTSHPAVRPGCGAAFSIDQGDEERLVIFQEVDDQVEAFDAAAVIAAIRHAIAREHSLLPHAVRLLPPRSIWKTTSGKIQRSQCKNDYLAGGGFRIAEWTHGGDLEPVLDLVPVRSDSSIDPLAAEKSPFSLTDIEESVVTVVADALGINPALLDLHLPLVEYGLDSASAVSIADELDRRANLEISPTFAYDFPTIRAMARRLREILSTDQMARLHKHSQSTSSRVDVFPTPSQDHVETTGAPSATDIAIVGMACRFPGARDLQAYWRLLSQGREAIRKFPNDRARNPSSRGDNTADFYAGLVDGIDLFDPGFFSISPHEAAQMDPQQRLLLEVAWEALESACAIGRRTEGANTGVFVGVSLGEYLHFLLQCTEPLDGHVATGNYLSIIANRLSYLLDLRGPSLAVDTACSSSLVAVHLAAQSLVRRECDLALAGGVQILLDPRLFRNFDRAGMLAKDGRCKTFDQRADGYVRGEGAGTVVLKRLADAIRDRDNIRAILKGSAVNQDGRTNGLTAPSGIAQAELLRKAHEFAGVDPDTVDYIEAHGTGTRLGDPIEMEALAHFFGSAGKPGQRRAIGTVKTNIGHLEAAAGIAGLIKVVLMLEHHQLPPSLHFESPNSHLRIERSPFFVNDRPRPWISSGTPRRAGVSSFGFGGTNAHVILQEPPAQPRQPSLVDRPWHPCTLSASSEQSLARLARNLANHLRENPDLDIGDVCHSMNIARGLRKHRLAVVCDSIPCLTEQLDGFRGTMHSPTGGGARTTRTPKVAFCFSGDNATPWDSLRELYDTHPFFKETIDQTAAMVSESWGHPFHPFPSSSESTTDSAPSLENGHAAAANFCIQFALAKIWKSWGIEPACVFGLERGEWGAAYFAGAVSLDGAIRCLVAREEDLSGELARVEWEPLSVAFLSAVTGEQVAPGEKLDASRWIKLTGQTIGNPIHAKVDAEFGFILAIGARSDSLATQRRLFADSETRVLPSPGPGMSPWRTLLDSLTRLYLGGWNPDWNAFDAPYRRAHIPLPTYPFDRQSYWIQTPGDRGPDVPGVRNPDSLSLWFHQLAWHAADSARERPLPNGVYLILLDAMGIGERLAALLRHAGKQVITVERGESFEVIRSDRLRCPDSSIDDFHALFRYVNSPSLNVGVIVHLAFLDQLPGSGSSLADSSRGLTSLFAISKALLSSDSTAAEFWLATRDAWRIEENDIGPVPEASAAWGMARVLARESPNHPVRLVDFSSVDPNPDQAATELFRELGSRREIQEVAYRDGATYSPRLTRTTGSSPSLPSITIRENGVYLVTGGLGGLGLILAKHLSRRFRPKLVLLSRTPIPPESEWNTWLADAPARDATSQKIQAIRECQRLGATIQVETADVADPVALAGVLDRIDRNFGGLDGIFHAAGIVRDAWLANKSMGDFHAVLSPKIQGTKTLDQLSRRFQLDFFVGYSSTAPLFGTIGQSDYAAANAFLDAYLTRRQGPGTSMSIAWTAWTEVGMAARATTTEALSDIGWQAVTPTTASLLLDACLARPASHWILCAKANSSAGSPREPLVHAQNLDLASEPRPATTDSMAARAELASLRSVVVEEIASALDMPADAVDVEQNVREYGVDSILATRISQSLSRRLGTDLDATLLFAHPTVVALAHHLRSLHAKPFSPAASPPPPVTSATVPTSATIRGESPLTSEAPAIAVIGMGCRFPGAESPLEYWETLRAGIDHVAPPNANRAPCILTTGDTDEEILQAGGFLDDVAGFDAPFFGISAVEVRAMDPQQRIFLEVVWETLESAGYRPSALAKVRTAVFAGVTNGEYAKHCDSLGDIKSPHQATGNAFAMVANRVSYHLDLRGPSEVIDTACSSSLVAVHRACAILRDGECDLAIAGGVNLILATGHTRSLRAAGMLSADNRCHAFDDSANGYVRGEGAGALLLKPLEKALRDGDAIWGVIKGTAVNHDGHAKAGFTAPNPAAQIELLRAAARSAGIEPSSIGLFEAHGTGTKLGDPIEFKALTEFMGETPRAACALGSVKTNIGHLESAAGIAGLIKAILAVHQGALPPTLHLNSPNRHIDFAGSPFYVNDQLRPWRCAGPRRAGVSSFGAGGTNAHVIVEEPPAISPAVHRNDTSPRILTLSARTESALRNLVRAYREYLNQPSAARLADLCQTANRGRALFEYRLAIVARTNDQLHDKLLHLDHWQRRGEIEGSLVFFGHAENTRTRELTRILERIGRLTHEQRLRLLDLCSGAWFDEKILPHFSDDAQSPSSSDGVEDETDYLAALAAIHCAGGEVDWGRFYQGEPFQRARLPTYPFERTRYWAESHSISLPLETKEAMEFRAWLKVPTWRSLSLPQVADAKVPGPLLFASDGSSSAIRLAEALRARGYDLVEVAPRDLPKSRDGASRNEIRISMDAAGEWESLFHQHPAMATAVYYWSNGSDWTMAADSAWNHGLRGLVELSKGWALARQSDARHLELRVLTTGGYSVDDATSRAQPLPHLFRGLLPTLLLEQPWIRGSAIDLDPSVPVEQSARDLEQSLGATNAGELLANRGGRWYRRTLAPASPLQAELSPAFLAEGAYLITGGLGGIGLATARWLARRYRAKLLFVGRRPVPPRTSWSSILRHDDGDPSLAKTIRNLLELESLGSELLIESADVADAVAMRHVLENAERRWGPLHGILHAAGARRDGRLLASEWRDYDDLLRAKVHGSIVLDAVTRDRPPAWMLLFSSLASEIGNIGQGIYGAANALLDGFAEWRSAQGRRTVSIAWGPWREVGMGAELAEAFRRRGIDPIPPALAPWGMETVLREGLVHAVFGKWTTPPSHSTTLESARTKTETTGLQASVIPTPLLDSLQAMVGELLELPADRVSVRRPLFDLGIDSVLAVRLARLLSERTGKELPRTLFFDYPTLEKLATGLVSDWNVTSSLSSPAITAPARDSVVADHENASPRVNEGVRQISENLEHGPIAVIGMAGRFPGSETLADFWEHLSTGDDLVREVPAERWSIAEHYGTDRRETRKSTSKWGAFLEGIDLFDPEFFHLSPREAVSMDPQQRLLLEVAWETLENAGYAGTRIRGSNTGVFVGGMGSEYLAAILENPELIDAYAGTGNVLSILANRLSFLFDLQGPCLALDTACSSSLVAIHLAVQSLRRGECGQALVGASQVGITLAHYLMLSRLGALSPTGRSRTFGRGADGYVLGEGVGMLMLKPLARALADRDSIHGVIRGSAIRHGGQAAGLTVPSADAQSCVIRAALQDASAKADQIQYVEAHGTGTSLGDPIEIAGLTHAFRQDTSRKQYCAVGSVKSNVGHLEPAAGIVGMIKVLLSMRAGTIPPTCHVEEVNPGIDFSSSPFYVCDRALPWPRSTTPRLAGISSFGFGGTNAHVIVEEPPAQVTSASRTHRSENSRSENLLVLSADHATTLRALARRHVDFLATAELDDWPDICFTAVTGRDARGHRLAVVADSPTDARTKLQHFLDGKIPWVGAEARSVGKPPKIAFLFTGQGELFPGICQSLYACQPTFRATIDACDEVLREYHSWSLVNLLTSSQPDGRLSATEFAQPILFSIQVSLARLWREWGIVPSALLGHSVGELAAACVAGVFSLADGIHLVATRGRLMQTLPQGGGMAAVLENATLVRSCLERHAIDLVIAGENSPRNTVVSGKRESLEKLSTILSREGIDVIPLRVSHAFHSPLMEPILPSLVDTAQRIEQRPPRIPLLSNRTGTWFDGSQSPSAAYWADQARHCVLFRDGVHHLLREECDLFLEIGPGSTLVRLAEACAAGMEPAPMLTTLSSLEPGKDEWRTLLSRLGSMFLRGAAIDWNRFHAQGEHRRLPLPTTPFHRRRFWISSAATGRRNDADKVEIGSTTNVVHEILWKDFIPSPSRTEERVIDVVFLANAAWSVESIDRLRATGSRVLTVGATAPYAGIVGDHASVEPSNPSDYAEFLAGLRNLPATRIRLLFFWTGEEIGIDSAKRIRVDWNLPLRSFLRALMDSSDTRLEAWIQTEGGQSPQGNQERNLTASAAWGIVRCARIEAPHLRLRLRDSGDSEATRTLLLDLIVQDLADADPPVEGAYRDGRILVPHVARARPAASRSVVSRIREGGVYVITGGTGALGLEIARALAMLASVRLVLVSRTPLPPESTWISAGDGHSANDRSSSRVRAVLELKSLGAEVLVRSLDVADRNAVDGLARDLRRQYGRIDGVVHAAGVLSDHLLVNTTDHDHETVFRGKVDGARVLADVIGTEDIDFFIGFSSLSAHVGNTGQSAYAAANGALEAFTANLARNARGLVTSIAWGPWAGGGMADDDVARARFFDARVAPLTPTQGRLAFLEVLSANANSWLVFAEPAENSATMNSSQNALPLACFHRRFDPRSPISGVIASTSGNDSKDSTILRDLLRATVADVIHGSVFALDQDLPFREMGIDSLMAEEIARRLSGELSLSLSAPLLYQHPTIRSLAEALSSMVDASPRLPPNRLESSKTSPSESRDSIGEHISDRDIAIIGYACRFPGAEGANAYWKVLAEGECVLGPMNDRRWKRMRDRDGKWSRYFHGGRPWGGFLPDIAGFDPFFFQVSPAEAASMDPRQRLFLETAYHAAEHAGYGGSRLRHSRTGVFLGSGGSDYLANVPPDVIHEHAATGGTSAMSASRLAYFLDLRGPSMPIDTACSSGLVAVHLAMQSLRQGECAFAFAGAVHLYLRPTPLIALEQMGALSADGLCRAFDKSASGFVPAEGVGVLLLRPLALAVAEGDRIHGVLRGSAVNNDGRSNGLTAPNLAAQAEVLVASWRDARIEPSSLTYIEAHGTGTRLGDPIEIQAVTKAFHEHEGKRNQGQFCRIGSVKSNLGHTDAAAGIAGIIKVLLAFRHEVIPASLHFQDPNPRIPFEATPLLVADHASPWPRGHRLAGVSAFGFSGTNAHVVLAEPPESPMASPMDSGSARERLHLFTLSARNASTLRRLAVAYLSFAYAWDDSMLADVCHTAGIGRMHGKHRLAFPVETIEELREMLTESLEVLDTGENGSGKFLYHDVNAAPRFTTIHRERLTTVSKDTLSSAAHYIDHFNDAGLREILHSGIGTSAPTWIPERETRETEPRSRELIETLATLYVLGADIRWNELARGSARHVVELPLYPFEHGDYWLPTSSTTIETAPTVSDETDPVGDWFHCNRWHPRAPSSASAPAEPTTWLVFSSSDKFSAAILHRLGANGSRVIEVTATGDGSWVAPDHFKVNPTQPSHYQRLFESLAFANPKRLSILYLWSATREAGRVCDAILGIEALFHLLQAMARFGTRDRVELCCVTRGAQRVTSDEECVCPQDAAAWGLLRAAAKELPGIRWQFLDADPYSSDPIRDADRLARELLAPAHDPELAFRGDDVCVPTILPLSISPSPGAAVFRKHGVYWITGGLGGIGLALARWLWKTHGARLVLTSRSPLTPEHPAFDVLREVEAEGAELLVIPGDVANRAEMSAAMTRIRDRFGELHGVFHAAGVSRRGRLVDESWEEFRSVLRPKIEGAIVLDELIDEELDFFVAFSSVAGLLGNIFQADYSAANRFLDGFAAWRSGRGKRTLSIDWGLWRDTGMGVALAERDAEIASSSIPTELGLRALERSLACQESQIIIAPALSQSSATTKDLPTSSSVEPTSEKELEALLRVELAAILQCSPDLLDSTSSFVDFGLDSMLAVRFTRRIGSLLGRKLSVTLPFDYPNLTALTAHLKAEADITTPATVSTNPAKRNGCNGPAGWAGPANGDDGANTANSADDMILLRSGRRVTIVQRRSR